MKDFFFSFGFIEVDLIEYYSTVLLPMLTYFQEDVSWNQRIENVMEAPETSSEAI